MAMSSKDWTMSEEIPRILKSIDDLEAWVKSKECEAERNRVIVIRHRNMETDIVTCRNEEGRLIKFFITVGEATTARAVVDRLCVPTKRPTWVIYEVERRNDGSYRAWKVYEGLIL